MIGGPRGLLSSLQPKVHGFGGGGDVMENRLHPAQPRDRSLLKKKKAEPLTPRNGAVTHANPTVPA